MSQLSASPSSFEVVRGGKLRSRYFNESPVRFSEGRIAAVTAGLLERLRLGTIEESIEKEAECVFFLNPDTQRLWNDSEVGPRIRYNLALLDINPRMDTECRARNGELGVTLHLSQNYPRLNVPMGYWGVAGERLGHLGRFEHLIKWLPDGTALAYFPGGRYEGVETEEKYFNIALHHGVPEDTDLVYFMRGDEVAEEEPDEMFLHRDYMFTNNGERVLLGFNWVIRIEGDNGSVWQNPFYTKGGSLVAETNRRPAESWSH